jgi:hypothetical protein
MNRPVRREQRRVAQFRSDTIVPIVIMIPAIVCCPVTIQRTLSVLVTNSMPSSDPAPEFEEHAALITAIVPLSGVEGGRTSIGLEKWNKRQTDQDKADKSVQDRRHEALRPSPSPLLHEAVDCGSNEKNTGAPEQDPASRRFQATLTDVGESHHTVGQRNR